MQARKMIWDYSVPSYEVSKFGFRVASVPEPATLSLLALGGLALLRRQISLPMKNGLT